MSAKYLLSVLSIAFLASSQSTPRLRALPARLLQTPAEVRDGRGAVVFRQRPVKMNRSIARKPIRGWALVTILLVFAGCWVWLADMFAERYSSVSWLVILVPWIVLLLYNLVVGFREGRRRNG